MKKRALISVSDKTGVVEFAKKLTELGYEIISTGGTAKTLAAAGVKNIGISDITGFPECLDGRVKTLHPAVHAGLLARRDDPDHMKQIEKLGISPIDVVCVNLYPFKATIMKDGVSLEDAVENIDIGGPTMIRAAAKNYKDVAVVVDPRDYDEVIERLKKGTMDNTYRMTLMYKVFRHTAEYDSLISAHFAERLGIEFPEHVTFAYEKAQELRYGENPHQKAAFYREPLPAAGTLSEAKQLHGKELSFNNINDAAGALELLKEFPDRPCVVASKHTNPCGVAVANDIYSAYMKAYECDPVSIFGGIVACNREVDEKTAVEMSKIFLEIVIAPSFSKKALEVLTQKKNIRLLELDVAACPKTKQYDMKKVAGGLLVQERDTTLYDDKDVKVVTKKKPTKDELEQMKFAYKVVKHTKSNAIVVARDFAAIGVGPGQTNRIWAASQAIERAGDKVKGAVLASDAFFPFGDCAEVAANAGITAIIQPGGSIRDEESIKVCDERGMSMIFVGSRHFKH